MKKVTSRLKRGFTLIELLVVIAIIGLLSSIVLASLSSARQKAKNAKFASELKQLVTALKLYREDFGDYPVLRFGNVDIIGTGINYSQADPTALGITLADYIPSIPVFDEFDYYVTINRTDIQYGCIPVGDNLNDKQGIDGAISVYAFYVAPSNAWVEITSNSDLYYTNIGGYGGTVLNPVKNWCINF